MRIIHQEPGILNRVSGIDYTSCRSVKDSAVGIYGNVFIADSTRTDEIDMLKGRIFNSSVVEAAMRVKGAGGHVIKGEVFTVVCGNLRFGVLGFVFIIFF